METQKKSIAAIIVTIIVLIAIGVGVYASNNNAAKKTAMIEESPTTEDATMMQNTTDTTMVKDDTVMKNEDAMMQKGSYEAYSPEKLALADTGKVALFFKASWCPTCTTVDADIKAHLGEIPAGTHILIVDYDNSTALKQKYGVTYQHTFVQVDSKGNKITKWSGSPTLTDLLAQIQ